MDPRLFTFAAACKLHALIYKTIHQYDHMPTHSAAKLNSLW